MNNQANKENTKQMMCVPTYFKIRMSLKSEQQL
jgi:hypothetical protein